MTNQDPDGAHFKGLIINFLHKYWPSLLQTNGFIKEFVTPVAKAFKKNDDQRTLTFKTMSEFEDWEKNTPRVHSEWRLKSYTGLGTFSSAEAKEMFRDLRKHEVEFT